ncbi:Isoflavone reductase like protein P3 [Ilyonectria robusta]
MWPPSPRFLRSTKYTQSSAPLESMGLLSPSLKSISSRRRMPRQSPSVSSRVRLPLPTQKNCISGPSILPPLQSYFDSLDALEKTSLEWAVVHNGTFLDYYAPPTLKSHYDHGTVVLDIPNAAAGIPGTGDEPMTFTYTFDAARFTIAALDLPSWPRELRIVGDTLTYNELTKLAEATRGVKFDVKYDDLEKLRRFEITELPGHSNDYKKFPKDVLLPFLSIFQRWMAEGLGSISREGSLNEMFPEIEPLTAAGLMDLYWKTA